MPPRRRQITTKVPETAHSASHSNDSNPQNACQLAAPKVSHEHIAAETTPESTSLDYSTSDEEITICDPPPAKSALIPTISVVSPLDDNAGSSEKPIDNGSEVGVKSSSTSTTNDNLGSLAAKMQAGQAAAAERISKGCKIVRFLTPIALTGVSILDQALRDLRNSVHCLWIADSNKIQENCSWRANGRGNIHTLQWKIESRDRPVGSNGHALIGLVGMVSSEGPTMGPDAGWQPSWGEDKLPKQKQTFRLIAPGPENNIPDAYWEKQWEGTSLIVENARKVTGGGIGTLGNCFIEPEFGNIRIRSPIFEPLNLGGEEGDSEGLPLEPEEDTPSTHRYATWSLTPDILHAFDRTIARGFEPQILEAYSRTHKLIHPNNVPAQLAGAIVLVYCTLERAIFNSRGKPTWEWQFYANLVKVQVLKQPPPPKSILSIKRKKVPGYGSDDCSGSGGPSASDGPSATGNHLIHKSARVAAPAN